MTTHVEAHPGWDRRRLVYGDWSWLVRDGLDVIRLAFFGGTIAFAVQGRSTAVALTAASVVLLIARIIDLPRWFDFGLIMAMTLIAYGTALGLYGNWFYYDKVVHGLSPVGYVPVLYIALVRLGVVPDPGQAIRERRVARISGIFIVTLAVGTAVGAGYENVEWIEDKFDILGGHFVKGLWDTETDLLCDAGGSLVGATFLTVWALRGWSSRRVTVVPAPEPSASPLEAFGKRFRAARGAGVTRESRLADLPLAAQGIALVAGGVLLLALPSPSLRTVGIVLGIALLAFAVFEALEVARRADRAEPRRSNRHNDRVRGRRDACARLAHDHGARPAVRCRRRQHRARGGRGRLALQHKRCPPTVARRGLERRGVHLRDRATRQPVKQPSRRDHLARHLPRRPRRAASPSCGGGVAPNSCRSWNRDKLILDSVNFALGPWVADTLARLGRVGECARDGEDLPAGPRNAACQRALPDDDPVRPGRLVPAHPHCARPQDRAAPLDTGRHHPG